jgi:hypothetical protein
MTVLQLVTLSDLEAIVRRQDERQRLEAANKIISQQCSALATAHSALLDARAALASNMLCAFENEDGSPVGAEIDRALHQIVGGV